MGTAKSWHEAFARQAAADFRTYQLFEQLRGERGREVPFCHQLQFLQMACEKLCKAHLYLRGTSQMSVKKSHKCIATHLPIIAKEFLARDRVEKKPRNDGYPMTQIRALAREIEFLSPSVDRDGRRPDNCEYPWATSSSGRIEVPADEGFSGLSLLDEPAGRRLLRIINDKIKELLSEA